MLETLGAHITNCLERAAEARQLADETSDPERKADLLALALSWSRLAESYEFSEALERFLLNSKPLVAGPWQPVSTAPFDRLLELAVISGRRPHSLAFPCRRILRGWVDAKDNSIEINPTHWREWRTPP
jgi:hypothetical protein